MGLCNYNMCDLCYCLLRWAASRTDAEMSVPKLVRGPKAGQVRYWQYGRAEKSPDLAILDLSRFLTQLVNGGLYP